jgi:hypothetical protein
MKNKTLGASLIITLVVYLLVVIFVPTGQSFFIDSLSGIVVILTFIFGFWAGTRLLEK